MTAEVVISIIILIYSVILHEISHGYAAYRQGDKTAFHAGRLTLNPISHMDMFGSVIVPILGTISGWGPFGWAKPVPINPYNLRNKYSELLVSAAGILANLAIFAVSYIIIHIISVFVTDIVSVVSPTTIQALVNTLTTVMYVNLALGIFNLIPVPPFDGMNILRCLLPGIKHKYFSIENNVLFMIAAIIIAIQLFKIIFPPIWSIVIHSLPL